MKIGDRVSIDKKALVVYNIRYNNRTKDVYGIIECGSLLDIHEAVPGWHVKLYKKEDNTCLGSGYFLEYELHCYENVEHKQYLLEF